MAEDKPKFEGKAFTFGDKTYVVPPLSLRQMRKHYEKIQSLGTVTLTNFAEKLDDALPIIHAAFTRNYPEMKEEELLDLVDLGNFRPIIEAVMASSGMRETRPGEQRPVADSTGQPLSVQ